MRGVHASVRRTSFIIHHVAQPVRTTSWSRRLGERTARSAGWRVLSATIRNPPRQQEDLESRAEHRRRDVGVRGSGGLDPNSLGHPHRQRETWREAFARECDGEQDALLQPAGRRDADGARTEAICEPDGRGWPMCDAVPTRAMHRRRLCEAIRARKPFCSALRVVLTIGEACAAALLLHGPLRMT